MVKAEVGSKPEEEYDKEAIHDTTDEEDNNTFVRDKDTEPIDDGLTYNILPLVG